MKLHVLILGGTVFLGRHLVDGALERDWQVTLFNRGRSNSGLYPQLEHVTGDRHGDLAGLAGRSFDAVIDTSGYLPADVARSAALASGSAGVYAFVSSRSVYADHSTPGSDEQASLAQMPGGVDAGVVTAETYGPLKALCERAATDSFAGPVLTLRPGLIVGPYDPTGRFGHWVSRIAAGGPVLAPGPPAQPVQIIDARDLATFTLDMIERRSGGIFNTVSPPGALTIGDVLAACVEVSASDAELVWVDEDFLLARGVEPWTQLPLWTPGNEFAGFQLADVSRALAAGLRIRPIADTVAATLEWLRTLDREPVADGLGLEPESALLADWAGR